MLEHERLFKKPLVKPYSPSLLRMPTAGSSIVAISPLRNRRAKYGSKFWHTAVVHQKTPTREVSTCPGESGVKNHNGDLGIELSENVSCIVGNLVGGARLFAAGMAVMLLEEIILQVLI